MPASNANLFLWKRPFQENKDWNNFKSSPEGTPVERWKRPFQENKDWNGFAFYNLARMDEGESAHSKKTRIETN